jgi:hypothetical protein
MMCKLNAAACINLPIVILEDDSRSGSHNIAEAEPERQR